jgi:hypothetical protein
MSRSFPSSIGSSACSWYTVGGKSGVKNLEQQIDIKLSVKIGESGGEKSRPFMVNML